jgi:hypothetical protein
MADPMSGPSVGLQAVDSELWLGMQGVYRDLSCRGSQGRTTGQGEVGRLCHHNIGLAPQMWLTPGTRCPSKAGLCRTQLSVISSQPVHLGQVLGSWRGLGGTMPHLAPSSHCTPPQVTHLHSLSALRSSLIAGPCLRN